MERSVFKKQAVELPTKREDVFEEVKRIQGKKVHKRGRKNKYYLEIDDEDDQIKPDELEEEMYRDEMQMIREMKEEEEEYQRELMY